MTHELRILVVGLATFATAGLVTSLLVPTLAARLTTPLAAIRARRLAHLRLLPSAVALAVGAVATLAFTAFEPRQTGEYMGWLMPATAALGGLVLAAGVWRAIGVVLTTRRLTAAWVADAGPLTLPGVRVPVLAVTTAFPVVAVVGVLKPRVIIARSVLASCSAEELQAVLAHEQGHIDRRDNLRRLLLSASPDMLAWLPASSRMVAAWRTAAEEAADDDAARAGAHGRTSLASALVKVARLASGRPAATPMPASALFSGDDLDRRVRRLLEPGPSTAAPRRRGIVVAALAAVTVAAGLALERLYTLIEFTIHALP